MEKYIVKLNTRGQAEREELDTENSLKQLQDAVGGYIERVPFGVKLPPELRRLDMFCDEEGLLKDVNEIVVNPIATRLYRFGVVVGNVVFALHDSDGETVGLEPNLATRLEEILAEIGEEV